MCIYSSHFIRIAAITAALTLAVATDHARAGDIVLTPDFDYSVPSRFVVPQIADPQPPSPEATRYFTGPVRPASWRVDLDACASAGSIVSYGWEADGVPLGSSATCAGMFFDAPDEGTYQIKLTVSDAGGGTASLMRDVRVQDWLIFGLGDSYASGEGVPDEPVTQAQLNAVETAQTALAAAEAAAAARLGELEVAQDNLADLLPLITTAQTRYDQWVAAVAAADDACDNFPPTLFECTEAQLHAATATANLVSALSDLGLEDVFGTSDVLTAIADLGSSAEQAVLAAQSLLDAAQDTAAAAAGALGGALDGLAPRWQSRQCHRSQYSGQVQAARALEEADPHTSVTFIHLACSGARITTGLLAHFSGQEPLSSLPRRPQIEEAAALSEGREVDAMVVSAGGNDVKFSGIIESCILQTDCSESPPTADPAALGYIRDMCVPLGPLASICDQYLADVEAPQDSAETVFLGAGTDCGARPGDDADASGLDDLPCNYDALETKIEECTDLDALRGLFEDDGSVRLYLTAYPSFTRREPSAAGGPTELCGFDPNDPPEVRARNLPGFSAAEMLWAETFAGVMLSDTMRVSAATHGWRFLEDHVASFDGHGYCADDNWIVRIAQSVGEQARIEPLASSFTGSVHPNLAGNDEYARVIADALLCDFYPSCDPTLEPRASREAGFGAATGADCATGTTTVCGDPTGDGVVSASDALQVLLTAVGARVCALCVCDVDTSGVVTATDALAVLRRAVGSGNALDCVVCV